MAAETVMNETRVQIESTRDFRRYGETALGVIGGLLFLEMIARAGLVSPLLFPAPSAIGSAFVDVTTSASFLGHLRITTFELLAGFGIALVGGLTFGALLGLIPLVKRLLYPYIVFLQSTPKVTFAPLLVVAFGFGYSSKIALAAIIGFFPVFINTMTGLQHTPKQYTQLIRSLRGSGRQVLTKVAIPHALPTMFAGAKTSLTLSLIGVLVAEFEGARAGLGFLITAYSGQIAVDRTWAVIIITGLLSLSLFYLVEAIERRVVFWENTK